MLEGSFATHFCDLADPRVARRQKHALFDILVIALLSSICGGEGWEDMAVFGQSKEDWLKERLGLSLENGVPTDDTFRRLFSRLDPEAFGRCFSSWVQGLHRSDGSQTEQVEGGQVMVDGKRLRGSFDTAFGQPAIHLVRIWAQEERLVLGASRVSEQTNEIPVAQSLLAMLDLRGALVSADAMHTQRSTALQIRNRGADYLLCVKSNQPVLLKQVSEYIQWVEGHNARHEWQRESQGRRFEQHQETDWSHARQEVRKTTLVTLSEDDPDWQQVRREWPGLRSLIRVQRTRTHQGKTTTETVYYISSRTGTAQELGRAVRRHWEIENGLHWVLDVTFAEDASRIRRGHAPENLALVRSMAMNLLRTTKSKGSVRSKRKRAGWDNDFLLELIA